MKAALSGIGYWVPDSVRSNDDWPAAFIEAHRARRAARTQIVFETWPERYAECDEETLAHLDRERSDPFTGAVRRRVADPTVTAAQAQVLAAGRAIADAGLRPEDIDMVLSTDLAPDRIAHPSATRIAYEVGASRARGFAVDCACASGIVQFGVASAFIETGGARHVLLTQSHMMSRAVPLMHPACPTLGDAASAIVVSASEHGGFEMVAHSDGTFWDSVLWGRGNDEETDTPWWQSGGPLIPATRDVDGARHLMRETVRWGNETVREALERCGKTVADIDVLACVQPRGWIPHAIARMLGVPPDRVPLTWDEYAHIGGCGLIVNLVHAEQAGLLSQGSCVALYAQGAGFTRAAAVLEWKPG